MLKTSNSFTKHLRVSVLDGTVHSLSDVVVVPVREVGGVEMALPLGTDIWLLAEAARVEADAETLTGDAWLVVGTH
jgi:hypothetical protein